MNHRVDIREDIKRYQDNLSYASSKVDYSVGENLFMLPSNMTLKIKTGTVGYNNKILVSDGNFSLGKNEKVNLAVPAMKSHKTNSSCWWIFIVPEVVLNLVYPSIFSGLAALMSADIA